MTGFSHITERCPKCNPALVGQDLGVFLVPEVVEAVEASPESLMNEEPWMDRHAGFMIRSLVAALLLWAALFLEWL